jgi:hypothetical protein
MRKCTVQEKFLITNLPYIRNGLLNHSGQSKDEKKVSLSTKFTNRVKKMLKRNVKRKLHDCVIRFNTPLALQIKLAFK